MKKRWLAFVLTIVMFSSNLTPVWDALARAEEISNTIASTPALSAASIEADAADASSGADLLAAGETLTVSEPVITAAQEPALLSEPVAATEAPAATEVPVITPEPTAEPTAEPTEAPTAEPTAVPAATEVPANEPAVVSGGTDTPADEPTASPEATDAPTVEPSSAPEVTETPTAEPSVSSETTESPTAEPSVSPEVTDAPTAEPSVSPEVTDVPTVEPSLSPEVTDVPTVEPSVSPEVTDVPTVEPSVSPEVTDAPTAEPSVSPEVTDVPTVEPSVSPEVTDAPTAEPSVSPEITVAPTVEPSATPEATLQPIITPAAEQLTASISASPSYITVGDGNIYASAVIGGGMGPYTVTLSIYSPYSLEAENTVTLDEPGSVSIQCTPVYGGTHTAYVRVSDASGQTAEASDTAVVSEGFPESPSVWESSVSDVVLTGDWHSDLLAIARSQIGNREYENCFIVDGSGELRYYTRYGHWFGAPYQDWCAMFIAFCLHYADIPADKYPVDAGCTTWKGKLQAIGAYEDDEDTYQPIGGDLVFINREGEEDPQHVGIVEYVEEGVLHTIEGNANDSVMRREYDLTDETIVGYANTATVFALFGDEETDGSGDSAQIPMEEGTIGRTTLQKVNMRSDTDVKSDLLCTIVEPGTAVSVLYAVDVGSVRWYYVDYEGISGYIRGDLLSIEEPEATPEATVEPTPAPVYYCGTEEHTHAETCYAEDGSIVCGLAEHVHTEECLVAPDAPVEPTPAPVYYCGSEEHTHAETCYAEDGSIVCVLAEHTHNEECLVAPEATVEPTPAPVYYCGTEEHTHAETCYAEDGSIVCGLAEHIHTEECLAAPEATVEPTPAPVYYCGSEEHAHIETCYAEDGSIVCGLTEHTHTEECLAAPEAPVYYCGTEEHTHAEACYAEDGSIVCGLTEHTHTEECLSAPEAPVYYCGTEEHTHAETCYAEDGSIVCGLAEHTHTEECLVAPETPVYYCGTEEHTHAETCYAEDGSIICGLAEHTHNEECLVAPEAPVYYCGTEEHTHAETCYAEDGSIVCGLAEHTHTEECLVAPETPVYYCGTEEHTHAETCYAEDGSIVCGLTEHTHTEECLVPLPIVLQLKLDQTSVFTGEQPVMLQAHVEGGVAPYSVEFSHTVSSTVSPQLNGMSLQLYSRSEPAEPETVIAQLPEAGDASFEYQPVEAGTHTLAVTVTDAAGTQAQAVTSLLAATRGYHETEEDFLASIASAVISGDVRVDIAAIAATQLGYVESSTDYIVENGQLLGYTRYGAWAQQPYAPWSASFVQFCLNYAGIAQTPVADAAALAAQLTANAQYRAADAYVPLAGDVVFFDWDEDGMADHTGLVANAYPGENGYTIETIEGDVDGAVITRSFVPQSTPSIMGYGQTAENPIQLLVDEVIAQIDTMPSADEFDAAMLAYEDAEDYEGLETWYMQTSFQIRQAYYAYEALGASRQYAVTNAAKLLELEYVWSAMTLELTPEVTRYCGLDEHTHGVDCYDQYGNSVCTLTVHTHTADCEVDPNTYYCGFEAHQHSEACLDETGMYGCLLLNHAHDESCLILPEITYNCGQVAHSHSIEYGCYAADETTLLCQVAPHTHSEPCSGILYCGYPADYEHTHGSCYWNFTITCGTPAHTHSYVCNMQPQYCVDPAAHTHADACEDSCLLHGHILSCWVNPADSGINTDPEGILAGATRFHSNVFLKYQATSHTVSSYEIGLFVLIPGEEAESSTWLPNTRQWSGNSNANYVLAYCSDDRTSSSKKGEFYDSYTMDSSRFTNDETRRKVAAIIGNSYPFLTAEEMRAKLQAAYAAGLTVDSNGNLIDVSDSVEADWIGATQWALWDTTSTFGQHPVNEVDIDDYNKARDAAFPEGHERYCINPLTDVGYADVATSRQKLSAIHNWLMTLQEPIELKVEDYTYSTDQNSDGTYNLTVNVTLNRAIVEGENTVFQLVAGNATSTLETLPIGQQTFSIVLQNISLADLMKSKVHLKVDGKHMQAYFFDSENYQDMLSGNWEYYEDDLSFDVGEELLSISVTKKWNEGIPENIDTVTVQLYADGVPMGDPVQIGKDNSWYYVWKDLYKRNASDEVINYTIVETAIDGYYSSLTSAGAMEELATITYWKEVDTFSGPGEYIFMSPFGALTASWFEAKNGYYMNVSPCDISVVNDEQIKSVWTVTYDSESGGYYVQSKAYPGQYMNADQDAIRSTGTVYSFANSHLKSGSSYFRSFYSNGYQVYDTNESLAMDFKLYKLTTETIEGEELNFQLTNTRITELDKLIKVSVTKEWTGRHDDLYPTQVQVQLYQDERAYGDPVTLTADSETPWAYTWPLLPGTVNIGTEDEHTFTYTVQEVEMAGYAPTVTSLEPTVDEDGTTIYPFTVTNTWQPLIGEFAFTKADKMNPAVGLAGAVFDLYIVEAAASETTTYLPGVETPVRLYASSLASGENGTVQVTHQGTDENGQSVAISGLELGETYYLVETKAPAGYNLLPSPIGFAVDVNGSASLLDGSVGWAATADADGLSHLTVYNKSGYVLPESGGSGTLPYTVGGLLLIVAAAGLLYNQFKRRREGSTA